MSAQLQPEQIRLVQESFVMVKAIQEKAAALFYSKLFELDPSVRPLFKGDMKEQGRKLMSLIGTAVSSLNHLDQLIPAVEALGARHRKYGVVDKHFETVGSALIWTLSQGLGEKFTHDTKIAWETTYGILAQVMKNVPEAQRTPLPVSQTASPLSSTQYSQEPSFWTRFTRWLTR